MHKKKFWFTLGLIGTLLSAPNATAVKFAGASVGPFDINFWRFLAIALITAPLLVYQRKGLKWRGALNAILAGALLSVSTMAFVWAVKLSQASYVSIITLLTPLILIIYSVKLAGEKISRRAMMGVILAAFGGMVIVIMPVAIRQQGPFVLYPLATLLAIIVSLTYPAAMMNFRIANEKGWSITALMFFSSLIICLVNLPFTDALKGNIQLDARALIGIAYAGLVAGLIARAAIILSHEHIGGVTIAVLGYLEILTAILVPVALLGEKLSVEMVAGGSLILAGIFVAEYHKSAHHKHQKFRLASSG